MSKGDDFAAKLAAALDSILPAGPVRVYSVVTMAAAFFVSFWLANMGWSLFIMFLPPIIALAAVVGKLRFAGPVFLALAMSALALSVDSKFVPIGMAIDLTTWFLALPAMVFLLAQYRTVAFQRAIFPDPKRLVPPWQSAASTGDGPSTEALTRRDPATFKPTEFWDVVIGCLGSLMAAHLILQFLPDSLDFAVFAGLHSNGIRAMVLAWTMGLVVLAAFGFLAYRRWSRLTPREAGVYLRSVAWRWNAKEHESLERYRAKLALRQMKR